MIKILIKILIKWSKGINTLTIYKMLKLLLDNFRRTGKSSFSLDDIKDVLKISFVDDDDDKEEVSVPPMIPPPTIPMIPPPTTYKFCKTKWYYGYRKINKEDIYKTIVLRIQKDKVDEFRQLMRVDDRQPFNHYDTKSKHTTEFDMSDCPPMTDSNDDLYTSHPSIKVIFSKNHLEFDDFRNKLGDIPITHRTKTVWYPKRPEVKKKVGIWTCDDKKCQNSYPIYIPSFKRADTMFTVKSLLSLDIDNFYIVIRPIDEEIETYTTAMKRLDLSIDKLLIVPQTYIDDQEEKGNFNSIPQRNYGYQHSIDNNYTHHWCLDDNIKGFFRREKGTKLPFIKTAYPFYFVEQYLQRYSNVYLSSLQYSHLVPADGSRSIIIKNSKVYSCILIKNDNDIMWRGKYNEDIVLTLDTLSKGRGTMTFQNFLCGKMSTGSMKGGNSNIYDGDGQSKKVDELMGVYPQYTKKIEKYGHPHHQVDYTPFKDVDLGYKSVKLNLPTLEL